MIYITTDDLRTLIHEQFLIESIERDEELLQLIEEDVIDEVKTYLAGRYDTDKIFSDSPVRTGILVRIIACMVVVRAVRRNAARKVPDTFLEYEAWAESVLGKIRDGKMTLPDTVPVPTREDGTKETLKLFGNLKNSNWYL